MNDSPEPWTHDSPDRKQTLGSPAALDPTAYLLGFDQHGFII